MSLKQLQKQMEELKKSINMLSSNVDTIAKQQAVITGLVREITQLKTQNSELIIRVDTLEKRVDDMDQYFKMNDVIVLSLDIRPRTYAARAATAGQGLLPSEEDRISVEMEVVAFLHSKGITIDSEKNVACHPLPRKGTDNTAVILRFDNRKHKTNLLRQGKALKGTCVYLNEHLTKRNGEIFKKARYLRKLQKIQNTWTANCKVFIKLNGDCPEQAKVIYIRSLDELDKYQWQWMCMCARVHACIQV